MQRWKVSFQQTFPKGNSMSQTLSLAPRSFQVEQEAFLQDVYNLVGKVCSNQFQ